MSNYSHTYMYLRAYIRTYVQATDCLHLISVIAVSVGTSIHASYMPAYDLCSYSDSPHDVLPDYLGVLSYELPPKLKICV